VNDQRFPFKYPFQAYICNRIAWSNQAHAPILAQTWRRCLTLTVYQQFPVYFPIEVAMCMLYATSTALGGQHDHTPIRFSIVDDEPFDGNHRPSLILFTPKMHISLYRDMGVLSLLHIIVRQKHYSLDDGDIFHATISSKSYR